jgi:hypothetical protein
MGHIAPFPEQEVRRKLVDLDLGIRLGEQVLEQGPA